MTHEQAIEAAKQHLHLVGKKFKLKDGETETIKTVVAWKEGENNWQPHVCFYNWDEHDSENPMTHSGIEKFFKEYEEVLSDEATETPRH
jgi:hypothetical protein